MEVVAYTNIKEIREDYIKLYNQNKNLSSYQRFEFLQLVRKYFTLSHFKHFTKFRFYKVMDENEIIFIFPTEEYKDRIDFLVTLDNTDLIYNINIEENKIVELFNQFLLSFNKPVYFKNIIENSFLDKLLGKNDKASVYKVVGCGKIKLPTIYDDYYNSLSKNSRQNLRTSYNRLNTDKLDFSLKIIKGKLDSKVYKKLKKLYLHRYSQKNKNASIFKKILVRFYEPVSKVCALTENGFNSILYINGEIAAFLSGMADENHNSVVVPRLVYIDKFYKYSPGILLVNETVRYLIDNNYDCLDLGVGDEKYKYVMGADYYCVKHYKVSQLNE